MSIVTRCCFIIAFGFGSAFGGRAQEWTRFRGPNGSGISHAKTIPTKWADADFNWRIELPGVGHSSPVLWGEKIFLTSCDEKAGKYFILCLDTEKGRVLWQKESSITPYPKNRANAFASSTPTVDAERVYVCQTDHAHNLLLAFDHRGEKVWERDLGTFAAQHGAGVSPMLYEDMVILPNEQDGASFLLAVEARTGQTRWQTPRKTVEAAYSTPCVYQPKNGPPSLIFNGHAHGISAIAPDTGKVLWEFAEAFDKRSVSSPVLAGDCLIGSCGSGGGGNYVVAVRPGDPAKNKPPERAYEIRKSAPYVPTSICVGGLLFLWSETSIVTCVQAGTGEVKWQERAGRDFFSSPVCVDDRLFCVSKSGEVVVIPATGRFEVLARNTLGELTHSTPAVAGGRMYIHTSQHLVSVGGKMKAATPGT
jgi:outer membrane protein assembly factor BamB